LETLDSWHESAARHLWFSECPNYYRARYYDSSLGRFLLEDPLDFAGGKNFYRYVGNNPVKHRDPLGLWQLTVGGGLLLGAQLTFGNNGGQYNFGLSSGVGDGGYFHVDPMDSGGCHKGGAYAVMNVHLTVGTGTRPWHDRCYS
jgi:RHS repeat-associated protein